MGPVSNYSNLKKLLNCNEIINEVCFSFNITRVGLKVVQPSRATI